MEAKSLRSGVASQVQCLQRRCRRPPWPPSGGAGSPLPLLPESRDAPSPSRSRPPVPEALGPPGGPRQARHYPRIPGARLPARLPSQRGARAAPRWRTATGRVLPPRPRPRPLLRRPLPARARRRRAGGSGCGPGWWGRGPRCGSWWGWGCSTPCGSRCGCVRMWPRIFEWWYFHKHGTSFIEQVSVNHLRPLMGGTERSMSEPASLSSSRDGETGRQNVSECKVWRNPLNLFRGAEYRRLTWVTGKEPLTYYDMNLSAQDHQTFFTCDSDFLRPSDTGSKLKVKFSRKSSLGSSFFSAVLQYSSNLSETISTTHSYL